MIPNAHIIEWKEYAPWMTEAQVEQDLILSRALIEIYSNPYLKEELAFRGGTALNKIFLKSASRYSEDIDLVRTKPGTAKKLMDALHDQINPWLGKPKTKQNSGRITFIYRFESETPPVTPLRLKVEINTREHENILDYQDESYEVKSSWFTGKAQIKTYQLPELIGTKMRALYQRKKGRDLFDLYTVLSNHSNLDTKQVVTCFQEYLQRENLKVSQAEYEENLYHKMNDSAFIDDMKPLLVIGSNFDPLSAYDTIHKALISRLPGHPWKGIS